MAMFKIYALDEHTKSLPTVDTASGSIATFDTDLTENLVEVKCQIVAKQSGSGTPSPSNPRPITTYTEMDLSICGKNLLNTDVRMPNIRSERQVLQNYPMKQGTYCFSFKGKNSGSIVGYFNIESQYEPNVRIDIPVDADGRFSGTITLTRDQNIGILCNGAGVGYNYKVSDIQIERGSQPTEFVTNGTTKRFFFNQEVANGVLDITTGKLRVTHGVVRMADLVWVESEGIFTNRLSDSDLHTATRGSTNYCEIYKSSGATSSANMQDKSIQTMGGVGSANFWCKDTDYTTASDFINSLGNYILVYPLATPIEIQLDSITLQALLNENNIWCDTGDTEVKYLLSVGKKIA